MNLKLCDGLHLKAALPLYHTIPIYNVPEDGYLLKTFWKKGETANNKHFLLLPKCFQPYVTLKQSQLLMTLKKKPFENIVGQGENVGNQHFLLFPQCFLSIPK